MFDMAHSLDSGVAWPGKMNNPVLAGMAQAGMFGPSVVAADFQGNAYGDNWVPLTMYEMSTTSDGQLNPIAQSLLFQPAPNGTTTAMGPKIVGQLKSSRTVSWSANWRSSVNPVNGSCADDGVSFPHRTLGWKMLKDDLFGIDIGGTPPGGGPHVDSATDKVVGAGESRTGAYGNGIAAHDIDSVCLDCHNPTVWNATASLNHTDTVGIVNGVAVDPTATGSSIYNDDVIQRGLP